MQLLAALRSEVNKEAVTKCVEGARWNEHAIAFYRKIGAETDQTEINQDLNL